MDSWTRIIAALGLLLILPAVLFITALVVRNLGPLHYEPMHTAQRIVMWYAGRMWTLWVLLLALPFTGLVTGCATLLREWNRDLELPNTPRQSFAVLRAHPTTFVVAGTTLTAAAILVIVALHMLAN